METLFNSQIAGFYCCNIYIFAYCFQCFLFILSSVLLSEMEERID